jgi:tellurium resistance protein TerZ
MLNMIKDQPETLGTVTHLGVGAAWKTSGGGQKGLFGRLRKMVGTDLDLCAVALSGGSAKRMCWFDNQDAFDDGTLRSDGDSRTGKSSGDDEFIRADLERIPASIDTLVFIVSAYKEGVSFDNVEGITLNVYDLSSGQVKIGDFMPDIDAQGNAAVVAKATRSYGAGWSVTVINELGNARSRQQLLDLAKRYV